MWRNTVTAAAVLITLTSACSGSDSDDQADAEPAVDLPAYESAIDPNAQRRIVVTTDALDPEQLRAIFDEVRTQHRDDADSWFVDINCASIPPTSTGVEARLANGKFANTQRGQAQTGLASTDDVEFERTALVDCQP